MISLLLIVVDVEFTIRSKSPFTKFVSFPYFSSECVIRSDCNFFLENTILIISINLSVNA